MSLEQGPIINLEQRRLMPVIERVLADVVNSQVYFTDPGFSEGFGGDDPRIIELRHNFTDPTRLQCTITAVYEDGAESQISTRLANSVIRRIEHNLRDSDSPYTIMANEHDTIVHSYFTFTRSA